jgi:hypothetical protein
VRAQRGVAVSAPADRLPALAVLSVACVVSLVVLVVLGTRLTFFNDDWWFLLQRPGLESHGGLDTLLAPHNSNLVVLPAASYKLLVAVFGLSSQVPYRIVLGLAIVAVAVMLFLLVSERAGRGPGLAGGVVVLFLGAAWEDLLFFASIDLIGSLATGLAALWVLERERTRSDAVACLLLICSVGFSNVGVPFAIGAGAARCCCAAVRSGCGWRRSRWRCSLFGGFCGVTTSPRISLRATSSTCRDTCSNRSRPDWDRLVD